MAEEQRAFPRRKVILRGRLNISEFEFQCDLLNISLAGAMIKLGLPLEAGAPVEIEVRDNEPLQAAVAWSSDDRMGIRFTSDPGTVRAVLGGLGENLPTGRPDGKR